MATRAAGFSLAYSRLCHFVALRRDGGTMQAAQDVVIKAILHICENHAAAVADLPQITRTYFSLELDDVEIRACLERLSARRQVVVGDGRATLSAEASREVEANRERAEGLEASVKEEWRQTLQGSGVLSGVSFDSAWSLVQSYLVRMFVRHGLQTLEVIAPAEVSEPGADATASEILDEVARQTMPESGRVLAENLVQSFLAILTPLRHQYLSSLLDGTFTYFALTVDDVASELFRKNLPPLNCSLIPISSLALQIFMPTRMLLSRRS